MRSTDWVFELIRRKTAQAVNYHRFVDDICVTGCRHSKHDRADMPCNGSRNSSPRQRLICGARESADASNLYMVVVVL